MVNDVYVSTSTDGTGLKWSLINDDFEELKNTVNELQNQVNGTLFTDEVLEVLLHDKISEMTDKIKAEIAKDVAEEKVLDIYAFISTIKKVIYSGNKTIVIWKDGSKTIVSCQSGEKFDKEKGLAMCIIKKIFGNVGAYNEIFSAFELDEDKTEYTVSKKVKEKHFKALLKKAF